MSDQLPIPSIELLLLQFFLGSITFIGLSLFLALALKKRNLFSWKSYVSIILLSFLLGNASSLWIWNHWPFSFDIMFGPLYLPGLAAYGTIMWAGFIAHTYLGINPEK